MAIRSKYKPDGHICTIRKHATTLQTCKISLHKIFAEKSQYPIHQQINCFGTPNANHYGETVQRPFIINDKKTDHNNHAADQPGHTRTGQNDSLRGH